MAEDRTQRIQHLTDQIVEAYQRTDKASIREFDQLTDIAFAEMNDEEVQALQERLLPLMSQDLVMMNLMNSLKQYSKSLRN